MVFGQLTVAFNHAFTRRFDSYTITNKASVAFWRDGQTNIHKRSSFTFLQRFMCFSAAAAGDNKGECVCIFQERLIFFHTGERA